jgi:hypothetical protein
MDKGEEELLTRMATAQERIAAAFEKQQPGRFSQALTTGATIATALGLFSVIDIIIKWIGG